MKLSKKPPAKFMKKRVGAREAKRMELLEDPGEVLDSEQATAFRALAARCNYLSLDRPDAAFASKELCREFASPTKHSVLRLKRLVRSCDEASSHLEIQI